MKSNPAGLLWLLLVLATGLTYITPAQGATPSANATQMGGDYRIAPQDLIQFQVHDQPDTLTHQRLTAGGELQLPFVGTVKLAGQTVREAEKLLEGRLRDGGFFIAPQVILSVERYRERYISVLGQVKNPDRVELPMEASSMGLLQAVARVGGFTRIAKTDAVQIMRTGPDGREVRLTLDVDDFLKPKPGTRPNPEFQLVPGDVVFVPERAF